MIDFEKTRKIIAKGLKQYLSCEVIRGNQTASMPAFPYVSYNITTLSRESKGTYGVYNDGIARKPYIQIMSITVNSEDYSEAVRLASTACEWLNYSGTIYLNDNNVIVYSVGNVTDRSNILTTEYIYSYGFDCYLWVFDEVQVAQQDEGEIEAASVGEVEISHPESADSLNSMLETRLDGGE